jgi:isopenicillin N synthase-like dioxygenase
MIPVIDLGPYLAARPGAATAAAAELDRALRDVGFFVVVNHGIPQALIDDTFAEARRFHAQPMDAKLTLRMNEHNLDTEIACLPTCQGPGDPPRYPPITYAAYLDWWYDANYNAARQRDVA